MLDVFDAALPVDGTWQLAAWGAFGRRHEVCEAEDQGKPRVLSEDEEMV